ncbi:MAG TPA: haloacid dehalogenase type II [Bacteroidia bacterium]|nr:haloacid dehalogenase type II [Bacteroidia bacterium]
MDIDFSSYKALTFDCYGTLIDWETGLVRSLQPFLQTKGHDLEAEDILALYARFEPEAEQGPFKVYKDVLRACMHAFARHLSFRLNGEEENLLSRGIQNWQPFPDTVAALTELQTRYKLCILSNIDEDLIAHSQRWLQVPFDAVITAEQLRSYKPAHAHFLEAPRKLGIPKSEILHVACSQYHDIAPARALGIASVWVNRRRGQAGTGASPASNAQADLEVGSLTELVDLVFSE